MLALPRPARGVMALRPGRQTGPAGPRRAGRTGGSAGRREAAGRLGRAGVHLAGERPRRELVSLGRGRPPTRQDAVCPNPDPTTPPTLVRVCGSGRCSPATAGSTSRWSRSSTPAPCGSPSSTRPCPASSPTTGPASPTWATSPPSTGAAPRRSTCCAEGSPVRTSRRSANAPAWHPAPGTRSGLWAQMAQAIDALQPEWVIAENVRGLLSAPAVRHDPQGDPDDARNPTTATPNTEQGATGQGATVRGLEPDP